MITIPTNNTTADLNYNENLCYPCLDINYSLTLQAFRLYLPTFPRQQVSAIIEIPFLLARKFAIDVENYFINSIELVIIYEFEPNKLHQALKFEQSNRWLEITTGIQISNSIFHNKQFDFSSMKEEYVLSNLKNYIGNIKLEIFKDIPANARRNVVENCKILMNIQCCWFVNIIGSMYFTGQNLLIRIVEDFCLDLTRLNEIFCREKEIIDPEVRADLGLFIVAELLIGIDFLHERAITHRFLSPNCIYFNVCGHLKIGNIFQSMNTNRDLQTLLDHWSIDLENEMGFTYKLNQYYLDPEVMKHLLKNQPLEAYIQLDCLADIFSIGIIITETLSEINFLSLSTWNDVLKSIYLPGSNYSKMIDIFLKADMQMILRQRLTEACGFISKEFLALILLMMQPKINRMRGLRLHVQRHRYLSTSGCEYKLRLDFIKKHPAFVGLRMDKIRIQSSPVLKLLTTLNNS